MDKIDYTLLRNIQNNEKSGMGLTELDNEFYTQARAYIQILGDNNQKNPSLINIREYENANRIFQEFVNIRMKKIVLNALQLASIPKNTLPEEEIFYSKIKENVIDFEKNYIDCAENQKISKKTKTEGFKKVKILKDIPQYKGLDGNTYGPYKKETSVSLVDSEAEFLISKEMAE